METKTTFLPQKPFQQRLLSEIEHFDIIYSKINLLLQENLYSLSKDSFHFVGKLLTQLTSPDRAAKAFAASLFQDVYRTEVMSAGSGRLAFRFGISFAKQLIQSDVTSGNEVLLQKDLKDAIEYFKSHLAASTKTSTQDDLQNIIKASTRGDDNLRISILEALKLSGIEGKIFIENGKQDNFLIEHKEGYNFELNPFSFMLNKAKMWEANDCKILIIDGLVEKVSELDQILMKNFETKQPMVIISHGFSEEVVATLKANQERGLLDIQPIRVPTGIDSLNVTNDIAVVCGTLPVSIMKGDLLVFKKYEDIPTVDHVRIKEGQCIIENSKTRAAVSDQIRSLLEKRQNHFLHEDVQDIFDKRMRSLISNSVNIYLPNTVTNKQDEQRVKIDLALRQVKTLLNNGVADPSKIVSSAKEDMSSKNIIGKCFSRAVVDAFVELDNQRVSPLSAFISCAFTAKTVLMLLSSSGFVEIIS